MSNNKTVKTTFTREEVLEMLNELQVMNASRVFGDAWDTDFKTGEKLPNGDGKENLWVKTKGIVFTILDSVIPQGTQNENAKMIARQMIDRLFSDTSVSINRGIKFTIKSDKAYEDELIYNGGLNKIHTFLK